MPASRLQVLPDLLPDPLEVGLARRREAADAGAIERRLRRAPRRPIAPWSAGRVDPDADDAYAQAGLHPAQVLDGFGGERRDGLRVARGGVPAAPWGCEGEMGEGLRDQASVTPAADDDREPLGLGEGHVYAGECGCHRS